mgnify:CR=1 FL=1
MKSVSCIIVTYNRLDFLKRCLDHVLNQSYAISHLIVVNNNSTDGTEAYLNTLTDDRLIITNPHANIGGAGGFSRGIKTSVEQTSDDFLWLMDDDTMPEPDCLKELINSADQLKDQFGFLVSDPLWTDGTPNQMNVPLTKRFWTNKLSDDLVELEYATFVSFLFSRSSVLKLGLPYKEYFIWSDDIEYSSRLREIGDGYLVVNSKVIHETGNNVGADIITDSVNRIPRYFYSYRNLYATWRKYKGHKGALKQFLQAMLDLTRVLRHSRDHKWLRVKTLLRGQFAGFFFHPKVDFIDTNK